MTNVPLQAMIFDHVGISVADLDVSRRFYGDVLGFDRVEDEFALPEFNIRGLVLLNPSGVRIELFERAGSQPNRIGHPAEDTIVQGWFQLALGVNDTKACFERAVALGAKPALSPRIAPDGVATVAFICDPDNNLVEFLQRGVVP